jgi:O-antigen ligase
VKTPKFFKKYWNYILSVLLILPLTFLVNENVKKAIFILFLLIIWNLLGIYFKDFIKSSFITLLLILPFNITYQLPYSFLGIQLAEPFVNGVIVNYLVLTFSILDLGVLLLLLSLIFERHINFKWKGLSFLKTFLLFTIYLLLQSIFNSSALGLFNSLRLLFYIFTFYSLYQKKGKIFKGRYLYIILFTSLALVIFQGLLSLLQFNGGTSLGLSFLGESNLVSGMVGSSFIELSNSLYLRGYGTFPHPNVLGGWLIFNILLGWSLYDMFKKIKKDRWGIPISIILMILSFLSLILTFSRISLLVSLIIWVAFLSKLLLKSKSKNFMFIGLISERVLNLFTGGDNSWSDRLELIRASLSIIKENILMGVGIGEFTSNMGDTVPRSSNGILLLQPVHNIFLLIVSEIGLIGFGLYSTLLYFFLKDRKFNLRLVISLVTLFIIGMFDHYLFSLPQGLGVFLLIILI